MRKGPGWRGREALDEQREAETGARLNPFQGGDSGPVAPTGILGEAQSPEIVESRISEPRCCFLPPPSPPHTHTGAGWGGRECSTPTILQMPKLKLRKRAVTPYRSPSS